VKIGPKLYAHLETWRVYTAIYPGLLALAAASLWRGAVPRPLTALAVFAVPVLGWLAALYGCDFLDSGADRAEKGHRPIPSGRLPEKEAVLAMLACVYLGLLISGWLGRRALLFAGAAMATSVVYGLAKSWILVGPVARGLAATCVILFGGQSFRYWLVLALFFLHDVTTNLIGEIRDVKGDAQAGRATIAARYGVRTALCVATALFAVWASIAAALPFLIGRPAFGYYLFQGPALALAVMAIAALARRPADRRRGLFAHKCFVLERLLLAGAVLALVDARTAGLVVLPLLVLACLTQAALRDQLEFGRPQPEQPVLAAPAGNKAREP
jgi:4-hydroxybenzoate polyprenyltransferase